MSEPAAPMAVEPAPVSLAPTPEAPATPVGLAPAPAPAQTPAPAPTGLGLGATPQDPQNQADPNAWFKQHLSDDYANHSAMQSITSLDDLAKSYVHAQSMVGKDKVVKVGADATPEAKQAFMKELGWGVAPEKVEDYGLSIEGMDGLGDLTGVRDAMGALLHKHGIPTDAGKSVFQEFVQGQHAQHLEDVKAINLDKQAKMDTLRTELGPSFDHVITKAQEAIKKFSPDGALNELIMNSHLEAEPVIIKLMSALGDTILGDSFNPGNLTREFTTTPDAALTEITQLNADKEFMSQYQDKNNPGHAAALEKMSKLFAIAYPEPKQ